MRKEFNALLEWVREEFGEPISLRTWLAAAQSRALDLTPPRSVAGYSVVQWHNWIHTDDVLGWRYADGHYKSFRCSVDELGALGQSDEMDTWQCDIQQVEGVYASKSTLEVFGSLDELVERNAHMLIAEITDETLQNNLAHSEIRILHRANHSDHFVRHLWDGRVFLANAGGSHHFSAARYIARRLGRRIMLRGKLITHRLNPTSVESLTKRFHCVAIDREQDGGSLDFHLHEALRRMKATYLSLPLPRPMERHTAVLLPKWETRSHRAAGEVLSRGITNLGSHLLELIRRQASL